MSVETVPRVSEVKRLHHSIPSDFGDNRRCRNGGRAAIAANNPALRHWQ